MRISATALLLALSIPTVFSKTDNAASSLVDWIQSKGGYFNPKQEIRRGAGGGIFATERIEKGQVLCSIPWDCIIHSGVFDEDEYEHDEDEEEDEDEEDSTVMHCEAVQLLSKELRKGKESDYAPYVLHLLEQPLDHLPSTWSEEGKNLLELVTGYDMLPPYTMTTSWLDSVWKHDCKGSDDDMDKRAALLSISYGENGLMVPLFSLYNHRNGPWYNTKFKVAHGKKFDLVARNTIQAGEQVYISYNDCGKRCKKRDDEYGTPELLRDYGFVEEMPQRWIFEEQELAFDLEEEEDGTLQVTWHQDSEELSSEDALFFQAHLKRLKEVVYPELQKAVASVQQNGSNGVWKLFQRSANQPSKQTVSQRELDTVMKYYNALTKAITMAIADSGHGNDRQCSKDEDGDEARQLGSDYYFHPSEEEQAEEDEHELCSDDENDLDDFHPVASTKSMYQELHFAERSENNMCLDLDETVQICSSYRPHYHELMTHFAARYLNSIKRAVFVGGGDSMLLHELLKYPDIELIVGLELDEKVVRHSFKHFHTQPHFDDERVQWWFGDATKSLLMLPKDYFGTFDLVLVDLSETVMAFSVTEHLDILEALALLLNPDGIFVKNEVYFENLSEIFDYTIQTYLPGVPVLCEQDMSMGSNRVDFMRPNVDNLRKAHNVETLLLDPVENDKDRFSLIVDYRKNDARAQGKCADLDETSNDSDRTPAGLLMVLEAENTTNPLDWETLQGALYSALQKEGLTTLTSFSSSSRGGGTFAVVVMKEGLVSIRTWPEEKYCAFDIQLWAAFSKMEDVRDSLANVVGSSKGSRSSFRIVVGGMRGTETWANDRNTIGPRDAHARDCAKKYVDAGKAVDQNVLDVVLKETLNLVEKKDIVVAVVCGDGTEPCRSLEALANNKNVRDVVTLSTCADIVNDQSDDLSSMFACEMEILNLLRESVQETEPLSALIVDASASATMMKISHRIWQNPRNSARLLMPQFVFVSAAVGDVHPGIMQFLDACQKKLVRRELNTADVFMKGKDNVLEMVVVSGGEPNFFDRLLEISSGIGNQTGIDPQIVNVDGGEWRYLKQHETKRFVLDDYDPSPGIKQFSEQRPLGSQMIAQLELGILKNLAGPETQNVTTVLKDALESSLERLSNFSDSAELHVMDGFAADGSVIMSISSEGTAIAVWDGNNRVDVNLFTLLPHDVDASTPFWDRLLQKLPGAKVLLRDELPRGVGRVVNLMNDILTTSLLEDSE